MRPSGHSAGIAVELQWNGMAPTADIRPPSSGGRPRMAIPAARPDGGGTTPSADGAGTRLSAARRRLTPDRPELVLAACLIAISVLTAVTAADRGLPGSMAPSRWWHWLLVVAPSAAVAFRRVAPVPATPVTVVGQMLLWLLNLAEIFVGPLVMIYSAASEGTALARRVAAASAVGLTVMAAIGVFAAPDVGVDTLTLTGLACAAAYLLGVNAAARQAQAAAVAAELAVLRLKEDEARGRTITTERQRIARELHDLVGHTLSVIAVRAEAAERVAVRRPEKVLDAVVDIGDTARGSLQEVRRVLFGLRSADVEPELGPVPSLGDIPALIDVTAGAGVEIDYEITGEAATAATGTVGAGAYRIVQEALTNVLKHAGPAARVEVRIGREGDQITIDVVDDGRGPGSAAGVEDGRPGAGITGMTERAQVLGGELRAERRSGGGFRVLATLPVSPPGGRHP